MMKRILTFGAFIVAVGTVAPVLSKGKRAVVDVSPKASRTNDLHLFRASLWQNIKSLTPMKAAPAIEKEDSAFRDQHIISVCGTEISLRKVTTFVPANGGPGPKVLIELFKVDVYNPGRVAGAQHDRKTGVGLSWGTGHILTSKSIDTLLDRLNKNAFINLGQLAPAFFDNLRALDRHDKIEVGRLPQLSATNAEAAELSLGSKNYYPKNKQTGSATAASNAVSSKVYEMINNRLSVAFKPDSLNGDELNFRISVKISDAIENPGTSPGNPVISKSEANLPVHSGDVIVLGGIGRLESRENPTHDPSYKWVFMGLPKPQSGIISVLFIKPTVIR
ncbi:hypothetical protein [Mucilaginibacter rubeus]|uniref:Type II and III secretion system protein n=1 Tax=Mucilaginibacter rubeus TaxID=2027860 RepID=A0A5C1HVP1_9SPHI|nr:hypothetical protein [Mucilaginibacter rubeus]QEM09150.1 type II and III secretion system protein [Mucilaginibacter rubeus]